MGQQRIVGEDPPGRISPQHGRRSGGSQNYKYTEAEKKVLDECAMESAIYRGLPLAAAGAGLAFYMVKLGKLSASVRYGALPKMCYAGVAGYLIGKMSYLSVCRAKLMKLENSPIADALKGKTNWKTLAGQQTSEVSEDQTYESAYSSQSHASVSQGMPMSSPDAYTNMDIDPTRPPEARQSDDTISAFAPLAPLEDGTKKPVTYAELRDKHRQEQQHMVAPTFPAPANYNPRSSSSQTTTTSSPSKSRQFGKEFNADDHFGQTSHKGKKKVNQYGDVIDLD
ncbi:OCIA domain-containing protein 1-like [Glandiceps talaboti]